MKRIILFIFIVFSLKGVAQVNIQVTLGGFVEDTVYLGKIFGKKAVRETLIRKHENGAFVVSSDKDMTPGIYAIIYRTGKQQSTKYFNFIIDENNKNFQVYTYAYEPNNPSYTGETKDNAELSKFLKSHDSLLNEYKTIKDKWLIYLDEERFEKVIDIEQKYNTLIKSTIAKTNSKWLKEVAGLLEVNFPLYTGVFQDKVKKRQQYLDSAFLSNFKAESETIWQIPNGIELMDFYCIYSADADHKKVSERSKRVLDIFAVKNPAIYKYYFNYLMNSFPRMSKYYYELATNTLYYDYIERGKADFFNENELLKIKNYVANFERLKVGNQVSDLRLYKEDKSPYNVFDSKSPYTLLMIWSPDCGHCKKELPILKRKYLEYKNKGIQVLTLSTKRGEKVKEGYDYLKTQNIPDDWINLNDAEGRSNFNSIYDVSSFPLIYLLDKDKKILLKRRGEMEEAEIDILFKNLN